MIPPLERPVLRLILGFVVLGVAGGSVGIGIRGSLGARCSQLSTDPSVRRVQQSRAFQQALEAYSRLLLGPERRLPQEDVDALCGQLRPALLRPLPGVVVVDALLLRSPESAPVTFGVTTGAVYLLTPIGTGGILDVGLSRGAWNEMINAVGSMQLADSTSASHYACLVGSIVLQASISERCGFQHSLVRIPDGSWRATFSHEGWMLRFLPSGHIEEIRKGA